MGAKSGGRPVVALWYVVHPYAIPLFDVALRALLPGRYPQGLASLEGGKRVMMSEEGCRWGSVMRSEERCHWAL